MDENNQDGLERLNLVNEIFKKYQSPELAHRQPDLDFFRYRIDSTPELKILEHQLRGEVLTTKQLESGAYVEQYEKRYEAWLNEKGIAKILAICYATGLNKNIFLGNLTHEEIYSRMRVFGSNLSQLLMLFEEEFEIKRGMKTMLLWTVINAVHSGLSRSEMGEEARQLSTSTQRHEVVNESNTPQKSSGIQLLNPFSWFNRGK